MSRLLQPPRRCYMYAWLQAFRSLRRSGEVLARVFPEGLDATRVRLQEQERVWIHDVTPLEIETYLALAENPYAEKNPRWVTVFEVAYALFMNDCRPSEVGEFTRSGQYEMMIRTFGGSAHDICRAMEGMSPVVWWLPSKKPKPRYVDPDDDYPEPDAAKDQQSLRYHLGYFAELRAAKDIALVLGMRQDFEDDEASGIVSDHAYVIEGIDPAKEQVHLFDPRGDVNRALTVSYDQLESKVWFIDGGEITLG